MKAISETLAELVSLFFDSSLLAIGLIFLMIGCFLAAQGHLLGSAGAMLILVGGSIALLFVDLAIALRKRRQGRS